MAIPEFAPGEFSVDDADASFDTTVMMQHQSNRSTQLVLGASSIATFIRPGFAEQLDDVESWDLEGSYVSEQVVARSLRILVVATEAPPVRGGIARWVGYLRDGLQERGHHVDVLAYPEVGRFVFGEVRLSSLIFKLPQLLGRINEYDVIHVNGATPTISDVVLLFLRFARLRGSRSLVIYTHHMDLAFRAGGFLNSVYNYLHHQLSIRTDAVVAGTRDILKLLGANSQGFVIPFGVDLKYFSTNERKDDQFTVLFIGQFRPYKGVRVLLQAMAQVTDARLLLAGQGPEEQDYRSLGAELGLDVEFHVGVNDDQLRQLYRRAHVIVMPSVSRFEAFGLALVEGMAAGCVPVASNLPGVREVVGRCGFLFPVADTGQLARILLGLRDDPAQVRRISNRARIRAAEFDRNRSISEYERLINGLAASRDLKDRLANKSQSYSSALHSFATEVVQDLKADWTGIMLCTTRNGLCLVASTGSSSLPAHRQFRRASSLLAQHAMSTGNSVLIGPDDGPLYLRDLTLREMPAVLVAPLIINKDRFGAILSMRKKPFDKQDLDSLTRFTFHAASSLHSVAAMMQVETDMYMRADGSTEVAHDVHNNYNHSLDRDMKAHEQSTNINR